jgi:BirA family biotin operon repressor/biotin-[acetyl-CoA-carboxylase] ligase
VASGTIAGVEPAATSTRPTVLELLADGNWHSGVSIGKALGLSRAAIWKQVRALRVLGLTVKAERGRGYQLERSLNLLSADRIRSALAPATREILDSLEVLIVTTSTNECLTRRPAPPPGRLRAVLAEYQTGGRGRRGRRWLSPLGHGVCLSVSWAFEVAPRNLSSLSLVAGVAVSRALAAVGVDGASLKWPNDVMAGGGKVGGILVEVAGESGGPLRAVIGIGLNVRPVSGIAEAIRQEGGHADPVGLDELRSEGRLERNFLVAKLLNALHAALRDFTHGGGDPFMETWRQVDYLAGRPVVVTSGEDIFSGIARGIADDGSLLVDTGDRVVPVVAGDVTLRPPS